MALDAKHRSSIYGKLVPVLGEDDANALMSQYLETAEVVTKDHLRAEMALIRSEFREEIGELRGEMREDIAGLRVEMADGFRRQQAWLVATIAASTAVLGTLTSIF